MESLTLLKENNYELYLDITNIMVVFPQIREVEVFDMTWIMNESFFPSPLAFR